MTVKAKGKFHGKPVEATAVNPGDWFGKVWLLYVEDCYDPPLYAVEADHIGHAIDIFIESEHGESQRIDEEVEGGDYGFEVNPGDIIGGKTIDKKGFMNLRGEFVEDGRYLTEPSYADHGIAYDGESIMVEGREGAKLPWPCVYIDPDDKLVPAEGMSPLDYQYREEREEEDAE